MLELIKKLFCLFLFSLFKKICIKNTNYFSNSLINSVHMGFTLEGLVLVDCG